MNDNDQGKKAKIILNSEIDIDVIEDEVKYEGNFMDNPKIDFNYNYRKFKRISGWWVVLLLLIIISIPIGIIYIIFIILRSLINLLT